MESMDRIRVLVKGEVLENLLVENRNRSLSKVIKMWDEYCRCVEKLGDERVVVSDSYPAGGLGIPRILF